MVLGRFTFERIHNTNEQIYFMKERRIIRQKSGCLNHSYEQIFQVNIQMQGWIMDSWKGGSYGGFGVRFANLSVLS